MQTGRSSFKRDCSPASGNFSSISHLVNPPPAASGSNSDRLVSLRTSLVEICCPARSAHVICPRQRVIDEVAERSPAGTNVLLRSKAGLDRTSAGWRKADVQQMAHVGWVLIPRHAAL
jgi:hypothetical protein